MGNNYTAAKAVWAEAKTEMELPVKCYCISEDKESVAIAKKTINEVGLDPKVKVICGGTEAAHYNEKGIETVVIG